MKKLHYNLRTLLILLIAGALLLNIALVALFGGALMGRYYTAKVKRQLVSAYETMKDSGEFTMTLAEAIENKGINLTIVDNTTGEMIYTSRPRDLDKNVVSVQLLERARRSLTSGDSYTVVSEDDLFHAPDVQKPEGICYLIGIWNGDTVELMVPMESVSAMAEISREFQILICLAVLLVLFLLLFLLSPRLVRPLGEMEKTANRIARLDFSARCGKSRCREIDNLGGSLNEMADRLQAYTEKLEAANAQLKEDIAEKERTEAARKRLIAGLSHDLKTPIALISGYADGLQSGMAKSPEQVAEYCAVIGEESDRMASLIARMLELSRLESGVVRADPENFCLTELLDSLTGLFRVEIEKAGITLERRYGENCFVRADYSAVEQVLTNYIQNAVFHMGEGRQLRVSAEDAGENWRVCVFNSAKPFSGEEQQAIWETFYRGERSRKRANGESGLGLAIVRGNMELLGKPYGVRNEADGVTFYAEFPKAPPEDEP